MKLERLSEAERQRLFLSSFCLGGIVILGLFIWQMSINLSLFRISDSDGQSNLLPENFQQTKDQILTDFSQIQQENIPDSAENTTNPNPE